MKALSVKQPWANRIATGGKTIELRTWRTGYRGRLLICSSKRPVIEPAGCAVAVVDLVRCRIMRPEDEEASQSDYHPGAWCWVLDNVRPIKPIPVKGALGIFDCPIEERDLEYL